MLTRRFFGITMCVAVTIATLLLSSPAAADPGDPPVLTEPVRPFDPRRDVMAPDSTPQLNLAVVPGINLPNLGKQRADRLRALGRNDLPSTVPGTAEAGWRITSPAFGAYGLHDTQRDVALPAPPAGGSDYTLYAPTLLPVNGYSTTKLGCVESVTIHFRPVGGAGTSHAVGFWDHCLVPGWFSYKEMNSTWLATYAVQLGGEERFFTEVYKDVSTNQWFALLYNPHTAMWENQGIITSASGPEYGFGAGWTAWESFGFQENGVCPPLPGIHAGNVQILRDSGQWVDLVPADSQGLIFRGNCIVNGNYQFITYNPNWEWEVKP